MNINTTKYHCDYLTEFLFDEDLIDEEKEKEKEENNKIQLKEKLKEKENEKEYPTYFKIFKINEAKIDLSMFFYKKCAYVILFYFFLFS
mgnify:CR=1 FL=1